MFENLSETYSLKFHGNLEKRSKFTEILERPQNNPHESSSNDCEFFLGATLASKREFIFLHVSEKNILDYRVAINAFRMIYIGYCVENYSICKATLLLYYLRVKCSLLQNARRTDRTNSDNSHEQYHDRYLMTCEVHLVWCYWPLLSTISKKRKKKYKTAIMQLKIVRVKAAFIFLLLFTLVRGASSIDQMWLVRSNDQNV